MKKAPLYKSFSYALNGILETIQKERNIKIHLFMMCMVIICGFLFHISYVEWLICILLFGLVISLEVLNTAIEAVVDLVSPTYHDLAKVAKDGAAGAVLISAIASAIIGLIIFIPKMIALF